MDLLPTKKKINRQHRHRFAGPLWGSEAPAGPTAIDFETIWAWKNTFRSKLEKPNYL